MIRKFIIFHYKHHDRNKADSTVNENQDFLNLLIMSKEHFMLQC